MIDRNRHPIMLTGDEWARVFAIGVVIFAIGVVIGFVIGRGTVGAG